MVQSPKFSVVQSNRLLSLKNFAFVCDGWSDLVDLYTVPNGTQKQTEFFNDPLVASLKVITESIEMKSSA